MNAMKNTIYPCNIVDECLSLVKRISVGKRNCRANVAEAAGKRRTGKESHTAHDFRTVSNSRTIVPSSHPNVNGLIADSSIPRGSITTNRLSRKAWHRTGAARSTLAIPLATESNRVALGSLYNFEQSVSCGPFAVGSPLLRWLRWKASDGKWNCTIKHRERPAPFSELSTTPRAPLTKTKGDHLV